MSENRPRTPVPRLGTPQIKSGPRPAGPPSEPAAPSAGNAQGAGGSAEPTRRTLHQHRRADSEAGAPAGDLSKAIILELPATIISPSDVGSLTGQSPREIYSVREEARGDYAIKSRDGSPEAETAAGEGAVAVDDAGRPAGVTVDHDGVPVHADGRPMTRRELREWRRRQETAPGGTQHQPRRAEAPAGSPSGSSAVGSGPVTRASLAAEGAALAARIEASGGGDPTAVDPQLLREQELLAERARQLNTGLITQIPPASTVEDTARPAVAAPAVSQEPVHAQSAHGLDSLGASAWSARERNLILAAGIVILALVIALILALVL